jgi:flagellin FlaB
MRSQNQSLVRGERGITGLETAIILIAFVVVAAVFAFTVLSTGVFSTERAKETVYSGLEAARSSIEPRGSLIAYRASLGSSATIFKVSLVVSNATEGDPVDMTPPYTSNATGTEPDQAAANQYKTVISFNDSKQYLPDVPWTVDWLGQASSDNLLERGEKAEVTVWLLKRDLAQAETSTTATSVYTTTEDTRGLYGITAAGNILAVNSQFTLEIKPAKGAAMIIQRYVPARLDVVMDLK